MKSKSPDSFTHSFIKHLLGTYDVPETVWGTEDRAMNKKTKVPTSMEHQRREGNKDKKLNN